MHAREFGPDMSRARRVESGTSFDRRAMRTVGGGEAQGKRQFRPLFGNWREPAVSAGAWDGPARSATGLFLPNIHWERRGLRPVAGAPGQRKAPVARGRPGLEIEEAVRGRYLLGASAAFISAANSCAAA